MEGNIIYGKHAVLLACNNRNSEDILRIFVTEQSSISLFPKHLVSKIEVHQPKTFSKIVQNQGGNNGGNSNQAQQVNSNGFACQTKPIRLIYEKDLLKMQNVIALDCVQDVGNIGAILRTAAAFGVEAVIYTTDKMPDIAYNSTVAKLSSGGIELVKLCCVTNLHRTLENLQKENFWIIGTDANGEPLRTIATQYEKSKKVVVFGNEENGIKPSIRKSCDVFASIKIDKQIDSLNVSAAASIVMWEMFVAR